METEPQPTNNKRRLWLLLGGGGLLSLLIALILLGLPLLPTQATTADDAGGASQAKPRLDNVVVGEPAPDFSGQTSDGQTYTLSDYRGTALAINFWATWCAPCRVEMPALQAAAEQYDADEFVILSVNASESPKQVDPFMEEFGLTFPAILDPDGSINALYQILVMPTTIWIDAQGIVRAEHLGPLTEAMIDDYVADLFIAGDN